MSKREQKRPTFTLVEERRVEEEERFVSGRRIVVWVVTFATFIWRYMTPDTGVFPGIEVSLTELYWAWWAILAFVGAILLILDSAFHFAKERRKAVGTAADVAFVLLTILQIFFGPTPAGG